MAVLDTAMEQAKAVQRDLQSGQMSLFSVAPQSEESSTELNETVMPDIPEWDERTRLVRDKETVGFYITGHTLDDTLIEIKTITDSDIHNLENWGNEQPVRIGGLIRSCKRLKSKRGDPMAFINVEDIMEAVEVVVFPDTYSRCEQILDSPDPVIIQGTVQQDERGPKIIADSIDNLPEAREKYTEKAIIRLDADKVNRQQIEQVKKNLYQFHGSCPILLTLHFPGQGEVDIEVIRDLTIKPCRELSDHHEETLHYNPLIFKKKTITLTPRKKSWNNGGQKKN